MWALSIIISLFHVWRTVACNAGKIKAQCMRYNHGGSGSVAVASLQELEQPVRAENDYPPIGRTIIHVNAMSTSVRHFLSVEHGESVPMSALFRAVIL
jgi:hypothetical protein